MWGPNIRNGTGTGSGGHHKRRSADEAGNQATPQGSRGAGAKSVLGTLSAGGAAASLAGNSIASSIAAVAAQKTTKRTCHCRASCLGKHLNVPHNSRTSNFQDRQADKLEGLDSKVRASLASKHNHNLFPWLHRG